MSSASSWRGWEFKPYLILGLLIAVAIRFLDVPTASWIREHGFWPSFKLLLRFVRLPGTFGFTLALASVSVVGGRLPRRAAAKLIVAGLAASVLAGGLKIMIGRSRPSDEVGMFEFLPLGDRALASWLPAHLSFPSGDAALAVATAVIFARALPQWRLPAFAWASAVCATRVLQGVHYPSDVLAGALVGLLAARLAELAFRPSRGHCALSELPC